MKLYKAFIIASFGVLCMSCQEKITIGEFDEGQYANVAVCTGYVVDNMTNRAENVIELWKEDYESAIAVRLSKVPKKGADIMVAYDAAYADVYNKIHSTDFKVLPEDLVSIANNGKIVVAPDEKKSYQLDMKVMYSEQLEDGATYILPLSVTSANDAVTVPEASSHSVWLVKNYHNENDADKGDEYPKMFVYTGCNPYNIHEFKLENGKYFFDVVCLFAANINYNEEKGCLYINRNENIQYWLDHAETYIRPLQKHGVKVILGLLCNWDWSCLAGLSDYGAQVFAKQLKDICDAYGFDGVNFDDEYESGTPSDPNNPLWGGYGGHNTRAAARLCYETKRLMPDKLVTVYAYGSMYGTPEVEGVDASEWIDIVVADYGLTASPIGNMTLKQCSGRSMEMARGPYEDWGAGNLKQQGYGWYMMFDLYANGCENKYRTQIRACQSVAESMYGVRMPQPENYWEKYEEEPKPWGQNW